MPSLVWIVVPCVLSQASASSPGKAYTSKQGGFSASIPAPVVEKKRTAHLAGESVTFFVASHQRRAVARWVATGKLAADPADEATMLKAARDDVLAQVKGKLGVETPIDVGGLPGREFSFEVPRQYVAGGAVGRARVVLGGQVIYEVVAVEPAASTAQKGVDLNGFLKSFRIIGPPTVAAAKRAEVGKRAEVPRRAEAPKDSGPYESKTWKYRVRFPGNPTTKDETGGPPGVTGRHTNIVGQNGRAYLIIAGGLSPTITQADSLEVMRGSMNRGIEGGKLLESREIKLGNVVGKEILCEVNVPPHPPGTFKKIRIFITGDKVYNVAYFDTTTNQLRNLGDAFLDSFEILDPTPFRSK